MYIFLRLNYYACVGKSILTVLIQIALLNFHHANLATHDLILALQIYQSVL